MSIEFNSDGSLRHITALVTQPNPIVNGKFMSISQQETIKALQQYRQLSLKTCSVLGIRPKTHQLLVGPTGCGKTAAVRALSDVAQVPWIGISCPSWIPFGANQQKPTLTVLSQFLLENETAIIMLDEIDKACPRGKALFNYTWTLCIFTEILALLDADQRLLTLGFNATSLSRLQSGRIFIIGAGSWQHSRPKVTAYPGRPSFHSNEISISGSEGIPEEIANRFNSNPLYMTYPSAAEFGFAIELIRKQLQLEKLGILEGIKLAQEAESSNLGVRWLEEYIAKLQLSEDEISNNPFKQDTTLIDSIENIESDNVPEVLEIVDDKKAIVPPIVVAVEPLGEELPNCLIAYRTSLRHCLSLSAEVIHKLKSNRSQLTPELRETLYTKQGWFKYGDIYKDLKKLSEHYTLFVKTTRQGDYLAEEKKLRQPLESLERTIPLLLKAALPAFQGLNLEDTLRQLQTHLLRANKFYRSLNPQKNMGK